MVYRIVDPFSALRDLQQALDSARLSDWLSRGTAGAGVFPAINIFGKGDDCVMVAELPGVSKDDIDITVEGNQVTISGKRDIGYDESASIHRRERASGGFSRTLSIPIEVDVDRVEAQYQDGVLAVLLPRADADKPRKVSIN